jgi:hypothetical protein
MPSGTVYAIKWVCISEVLQAGGIGMGATACIVYDRAPTDGSYEQRSYIQRVRAGHPAKNVPWPRTQRSVASIFFSSLRILLSIELHYPRVPFSLQPTCPTRSPYRKSPGPALHTTLRSSLTSHHSNMNLATTQATLEKAFGVHGKITMAVRPSLACVERL